MNKAEIKCTIGQNIKRAREQKGMKQTELAAALKKSPYLVCSWELGRVLPSTESLFELADLFGCSLDELTGRESNVVPLDYTFEEMMISAERYALGRRTYIVGDTVTYLKWLIGRLSDSTLRVMLKDIEEEQSLADRINDPNWLGDECDKNYWLSLKSKLETELFIRKKEAAQ